MSRKQDINRQQRKPVNPMMPKVCRHCAKALTSPTNIRRSECRSCWRVAKVVAAT